FDMDGLLVDTEPLTDIALETVLAAHQCQVTWTPELNERLMGRRMSEILAVLHGLCGLAMPVANLHAHFEQVRLEVIRGRLTLLPGAAELLAFAHARRLPLALGTSGFRTYVEAILTELELANTFDVVVTGDEVTHGKPAPDVYLQAVQGLGVPAAQCVVFDDAPAGIAAAVAAGTRAIAVPNQFTRNLRFAPAPECTLPDLHAAIPWLADQVQQAK
ncbi:MAG: HAD-IA family hydrolase, partial [Thermomicrobiales bacterium]|nr:HAD-IA family hydrolase [Thermomicrobiales bacterium]